MHDQRLTPQQLQAVFAYAMENGRSWKTKLNDDWMASRARVWTRGDEDYSAELQQVRNKCGPMWLKKFKLPPHEVMVAILRGDGPFSPSHH